MVTKMRRKKNNRKSETETKLRKSGTIKEEKVIRKTTSKGHHRKTRATDKASRKIQSSGFCKETRALN